MISDPFNHERFVPVGEANCQRCGDAEQVCHFQGLQDEERFRCRSMIRIGLFRPWSILAFDGTKKNCARGLSFRKLICILLSRRVVLRFPADTGIELQAAHGEFTVNPDAE